MIDNYTYYRTRVFQTVTTTQMLVSVDESKFDMQIDTMPVEMAVSEQSPQYMNAA